VTKPRVTKPRVTKQRLTLRMVTIVTTALLAAGAITAARLAFAELLARRDTPDSLRRAAQLAPNAAYFERLADLDPDHANESLGRALDLNPRSSGAWIARGLVAERLRDFAGAAQALEQAARLDRQYLPAWTLANFYFRLGDRASFWEWARRAAALAYDDPAPLLTLADRVGRMDRLEPRRAIAHLGGSAKLERAYLDLLIDEGRLDDAQSIARTILERCRAGRGSREDTSRLRAFTTRLIAADRGAEALEIWNGIGARSDRASVNLINADRTDAPAPSGEGFDWRLPSSDGVSSACRDSVLDFALDGREPDTAPLLDRVVAVPIASAGHRWRVRFEYSTGLAGLRWAFDTHASVSLEPSAPLETSLGWREAEWSFTPARRGSAPVSLGRLVLFYRRDFTSHDTGATPAEGRLKIRNLQMEVE